MNKKRIAYKNTKVDYIKSQMKINQYLNSNEIFDIQHSIYEGKATLTFIKKIFAEKREFKVGIKMTLPNINEKSRNAGYRILYYYIKSKFEAIEYGLMEEENNAFIKEFLPYVIADRKGNTVADLIMPQLEKNALTTETKEQLFIMEKLDEKVKETSIHDKYIQEKKDVKFIDADYEVKQ